jgi:hypothetical protein
VVDEAGYNLRLATPDDGTRIRAAIRYSLGNPEGKAGRKSFTDSAERGELLLMERQEGRGTEPVLLGFIEWRSRVDGGVTIRDLGSIGEQPQPTILKRLVREMLGLVFARPGEVTVKVRTDLEQWTSLFGDLPGFQVAEREFSRGAWWAIWEWTGEPEHRPRNANVGRRR